MTPEKIRQTILDMFNEKYNIDLSKFPDDYRLVDLENLNPKLDSIEITNFIFDVEDKFNVRVEDEGVIPQTLGDFYKLFEDHFNKGQNV